MQETWRFIVRLSAWICLVNFANSKPKTYCGDRLTTSRGVISTPNFPGPFEVPIKCRWVIDASELIAENGSIVVYLTQLYVFKGLTFTEYAYYESESLSFGAAKLTEITEGNVFEYRWLKTFRPVLVVDFTLDRLEGNHVRVLNDLLDVYGFNITYEMTNANENPTSCSVRDCSYCGNCFLTANYSKFRCQCFEGFHAPDCSDGPLCLDAQRRAICQNGATCRHVGAEAIRCRCKDGFTGNYCEIPPPHSSEAADCVDEGCVMQCPFSGDFGTGCNCRNSTRLTNGSGRSRYESGIKLSNVTSLRSIIDSTQDNVESILGRQIAKHFKTANLSSIVQLKILSVTPNSEVDFHFFGNTNDGEKIRESLNRLVQRRRLGDIPLDSSYFTFEQKPALRLQSLRLNQVNDQEIRVGERFVLSCVAEGSQDLKFTWYKDGMFVNTSKATRDIWIKHYPNDASEQHTSLLGIEKAAPLDTGRYTCQVIDWGMQQCKSVLVEVREEPEVRVVPMSATIEKGNDVQLRCLTPNMRSIGIGFGWSKNRALLKLEPGSVVWEDLYPAGSILKITNAQKSAIYTCNVAQRSMAVRVEVVNRTSTPICPREKSWGVEWPDTVPGLEALLDCPKNFVGHRVSRLCSMKDATTPEWQLPDFSSCFYEPLLSPFNTFHSFILGYQNASVAEVINAYWGILQSRKLHLYPGEGDLLIGLLAEIEEYLNATRQLGDLFYSAESIMRIVNLIVENTNSILNQQKLFILQQLARRNLVYWSKQLLLPRVHLDLSMLTADILPLQNDDTRSGIQVINIPISNNTHSGWHGDRVVIRLHKNEPYVTLDETPSGIGIIYKNITAFLPSMYVTQLDDGTDLEYRINSRIVTADVVLPDDKKNRLKSQVSIELHLRHIKNYSGTWNVSCGAADAMGGWNLRTCSSSTHPGASITRCTCPHPGTIAVFLTARAARVALNNRRQSTLLVVIVGCGSGALQCLISALVLGCYWWKHRTWLNFLKLQCSSALAVAMVIFSYAIYSNLSKSSYPFVALSLEGFLLVGMSAPVSQALIIYTELTQARRRQHLPPALIAGGPVLAVLTTELAQKSTGWHYESWWLIANSGVLVIFITYATTKVVIFVVLHVNIVRKAHTLVKKNVIKKETVEIKLRLLRRAAIILFAIVSMEVASVFYINSSSPIVHYIFGTMCFVLGFIVLVLYVLHGEVQHIAPMLKNMKWTAGNDEPHVSDTIKVCSKVREDMENESGQPMANVDPYLEARGVAAGSVDAREYMSEPMPCYKNPGISPVARYLPEIRIDNTDNIDLENYNTSPRKYQDPMVELSGCSESSGLYSVDSYGAGPDLQTAIRGFNQYTTPQTQKVQAPSIPMQNLQTTTFQGHAEVQRQGHSTSFQPHPHLQSHSGQQVNQNVQGHSTTITHQAHQTSPGQKVAVVVSECLVPKLLCNAEVESRRTLPAMPDVTMAIKSDIEAPIGVKPLDHATTIPDIAKTTERKQPDGEEEMPEITITDCESTASGMLDRISHDLDYLLNRNHKNEA